jgi:hypothetical protein
MKSHIKSKKFYQEAENIQKGWGRILKKMDILKDKVAANSPISIKDYCFTLYGDCYTSHCWERFEYYYVKNFGDNPLSHKSFQKIFKEWVNSFYDVNDQYPVPKFYKAANPKNKSGCFTT